MEKSSKDPRINRIFQPFQDARTRRPLTAFLVSEFGDGISSTVIPLGVFSASGNTVALAATFSGRLFLGSAFSAIGGFLADRWNRKRLLVFSYLLRMLLIASLIAIPDGEIVLYGVLGALAGASGAFDNPAAESALRACYRHDLQAMAAARKTARATSTFLGPAAGGVLYGVGGDALALTANIVTFLTSLAVLLPWRIPQTANTDTRLPHTELNATDVKDASDHSSRQKNRSNIAIAFLSSFSSSFLVGLSIIVVIPYLDRIPHTPEGAYGYALAAYSVGSFLGLWFAGAVSWGRWNLAVLLALSNSIYALLVMLSVSLPSWQMLAIAWLLWGVAFGPESVVADARIAADTADNALGRLYAWWSIVGMAGSAIAFLASVFTPLDSPGSSLLLSAVVYLIVVPTGILFVGAITSIRHRSHGAKVG